MGRVNLVPGAVGPVLMHLGELHDYEKLLVAIIAFGPFVVLAVVVLVLRRRDHRAP